MKSLYMIDAEKLPNNNYLLAIYAAKVIVSANESGAMELTGCGGERRCVLSSPLSARVEL